MKDPTRPGVRTEADVDTRIVIPYLAALGIQPDQIRAQHTFSLRLGRNTHHVKSGSTRTGRLDYLIVNADGCPLFVVELKGPQESLTDDDRDQGISYARLVHPMAPLVLVTNGKDRHLYDTITREQLDDPETATLVRGDGRLSDDESLGARAEALDHFIGYSTENVAAFSRAQRRARMETLGGGVKRKGKYEADLYVRRDSARHAFSQFLASSRIVFALVGPSGFGKTNELCALAEEMGETNVTLFFNGADLVAPLDRTLASEFDWHFSEALPLPQLCRRLAALAARSGRPVLIVIDAVDEVANPGFPRELADLALHLDEFDGRVRLVVSAKPYEWWRFIETRGNPSALRSRVFETTGNVSGAKSDEERKLAADVGPISALVGRFSPEERSQAIESYSAAFGITGSWRREVLELARDPFMLRMIAEVAALAGHIPDDTGEMNLVLRYVEEKLRRTLDPELARRELTAVADALARTGTGEMTVSTQHPEQELDAGFDEASVPTWVPEGEILRSAGLPSTAGVGKELVAFGVLLRSVDVYGKVRLAFAYDRVRDYVVATHTLHLQDLPEARFQEAARTCFASDICAAALRWYLPYATADQWKGFVGAATHQIERVLDAYRALREHVAQPIRERLDPIGAVEIGVTFSAYQPDYFALGFFRREQGLPPVVFDPMVGRFGQEHVGKTIVPFRLLGDRRGAAGFWFLRDPELYGCTHFKEELERVVKDGDLAETSATLTEERVVALGAQFASTLHLPRYSRRVQRFADHFIARELFPLDLQQLDQAVQVELALRSYQDEHMQERYQEELERLRAAGERPTTISYSSAWTTADLRAWRERAVREVREGRRFTRGPRRKDGLTLLAYSVEDLLKWKRTIEESPVPPPDVPDDDPIAGAHNFEDGYSDEQLARLLEILFDYGLDAYERILDDSFSAELRALFPPAPAQVGIICRRRALSDRLNSQFSASVEWGIAHPEDGDVLKDQRAIAIVVVRWDATDIQVLEPNVWNSELLVSAPLGQIRLRVRQSSMLSSVIWPHDPPDFARSGSGSAARRAPVRAMAYARIRRALKELSAEQFRPFISRSST